MINLLEVVEYTDSWNMTFYYVGALVLLIGIFWTYMQVFVKGAGKKKKEPLKENIIYHDTEDVIEESFKEPKPNKNNKKYYYKNNNNNKNKKNNNKYYKKHQ